MSVLSLKDREQLFNEAVRRFEVYTDAVTYLGPNSVAGALLYAMAGLAENGEQHAAELERRAFLMNSRGAFLAEIAKEHGRPNAGSHRAKVYMVVAPQTAVVSVIAGGGPYTFTVADSSIFQAGDSIRVRGADGTVTEISTVINVPTSTTFTCALAAPNVVAWQADIAAGDEVMVLFRATVAADTTVTTQSGVAFQTIEAVTTGDMNPIMAGEFTALSLADKVWCEATIAGARGNIGRMSITGLSPTVRGVKRVFNPEMGDGGAETESDSELKYNVAHQPVDASQEAMKWFERLVKEADSNALRVLLTSTFELQTIALKALKRNGGPFTATELQTIASFMTDRCRYGVTISVSNVTMTSIAVEAQITLDPGVSLSAAWRAMANSLAVYLDWRRWQNGVDVDESELYARCVNTAGIATVDIGTFVPSNAIPVGDESFPYLSGLRLENTATGEVIDAELESVF